MARSKIIYQEKFKSPMVPKKEYFPIFKHIPEDMEVSGVEILETGIVERDGNRTEYQYMKVYFKAKS